MPVFVLPTLAALIAGVAWLTRDTGVPIPLLSIRFDLWGFAVNAEPQPWHELLAENMAIYAVFYLTAHFALYLEPGRSLFKPLKFNPAAPRPEMLAIEMFRSTRGVLIGTAWEVLFNRWFASGAMPIATLDVMQQKPVGLFGLALGAAISSVVNDAHFYWTHRWLHTRWLYAHVHKDHHQSYNPQPFSGLSMHWFESVVYFSADPLLALFCPKWVCRISTKSHIVFPLGGHCGHGSMHIESSCNHYIHHAKFNWNYGASPFWDRIMGTNYVAAGSNGAARTRAAQKQAALAGVEEHHMKPE